MLTSYTHVAILREVKYKGWLHFIFVEWLWNFNDLNFCIINLFLSSLKTVTWSVETWRMSLCIKIVVKYLCAFCWYYYIQLSDIYCSGNSPPVLPILTHQSTPLHPVCLRSILILYRYPRLEVPWGLCPSRLPTKTLRSFPFCIVCATCPTHLVFPNLICVWIDLAQDEDSLWAVANSVTNFRAALKATDFLNNWSTLSELVIACDHSC